jgi:hypothetical protein
LIPSTVKNPESQLDLLWDLAPLSSESALAGDFADQPDALQTYLRHSIAPGTPLAQAVRLKMRGRIKLGPWYPFQAEEVIVWNQGMVWQASVRWHGLPIRGADRLLQGMGSQEWKLLGLIPVVQTSGKEITRSTIGRVQAESIWLPSILAQQTHWITPDPYHLQTQIAWQGQRTQLNLTIDACGGLQRLQLHRWGNPGPGGTEFREARFGGVVEAESTFSGYTIPTHLRIGWYPDTDRFSREGEFLQVQIIDAIYR